MKETLSVPKELIRVSDQEAREMLAKLAATDLRDNGTEVEWLIRQEYARRYSSPTQITLDEAIERR